MIPFMTEAIYQNIVRRVDASAPESIHLCDFPVADESRIDKDLEASMDEVLKVVVLGRACRNMSSIKNRQPLADMYVRAPGKLDDYYVRIIEEELNVRRVTFTDDVRDFTTYTFKPQLRTVGPKYGKHLGTIKNVLAGLDGNKAMDELDEKGTLTFEADGETITLTRDDLLIEMMQKPGYVSQEGSGLTVVIDTNLTDELREEGFASELISKIQTMRKDSGFEVMDRIRLSLSGNDMLYAIAKKNEAAISTKVLADTIEEGVTLANEKQWNINGEMVTIGVEKR